MRFWSKTREVYFKNSVKQICKKYAFKKITTQPKLIKSIKLEKICVTFNKNNNTLFYLDAIWFLLKF